MAAVLPLEVDELAGVVPDLDDGHGVVLGLACHTQQGSSKSSLFKIFSWIFRRSYKVIKEDSLFYDYVLINIKIFIVSNFDFKEAVTLISIKIKIK